MQAPESIPRIVVRALGVTLRSLAVLIPLAALVAIPGTALCEYATTYFQNLLLAGTGGGGAIDPQQVPILAMSIAEIVVLPWTCIAGSFAAAAIVFVYVQAMEKRTAGLGDTVEYALFHWRRLIVPFTLATLIIWAGSVVIIPGILYTLLYAFVVPVAVLDPTVKHVLRRSTRLTRGRRGRIFRTYMVFIPWWGWYATVGALVLAGQPWWVRYLATTADELVGFVIGFALLALYLERKQQLEDLLASESAGENA